MDFSVKVSDSDQMDMADVLKTRRAELGLSKPGWPRRLA